MRLYCALFLPCSLGHLRFSFGLGAIIFVGYWFWVGDHCALARRKVKLAASGRCGSMETVDMVALVQIVLWAGTLPRPQVKNSCHLSFWVLFLTVTPKFLVIFGRRVSGG